MMLNMKNMLTMLSILYFFALSEELQPASAQTEGILRVKDDVVLHFKVMGQGTPVLLLSGGPGISSDYLFPIANEISKTNKAILLDQRGTGKSQLQVLDDSTINLLAAINDIEALRTNLEIDKLIIVGHSWGGILSMAYAAQYTANVKALVLVSSGGMTTDSFDLLQANIQARLQPEDLETMKYWSEPSRMAADAVRSANEIMKASLPAYFYNRDFMKMIEITTTEAFNAEVNHLMIGNLYESKYDLRAHLKDFKQPVLIVQGRQDPVGESTAYENGSVLTNSTIEFIEECGHFAWVEQPEKFFTIINKFLRNLR